MARTLLQRCHTPETLLVCLPATHTSSTRCHTTGQQSLTTLDNQHPPTCLRMLLQSQPLQDHMGIHCRCEPNVVVVSWVSTCTFHNTKALNSAANPATKYIQSKQLPSCTMLWMFQQWVSTCTFYDTKALNNAASPATKYIQSGQLPSCTMVWLFRQWDATGRVHLFFRHGNQTNSVQMSIPTIMNDAQHRLDKEVHPSAWGAGWAWHGECPSTSSCSITARASQLNAVQIERLRRACAEDHRIWCLIIVKLLV